MKKGKSTQTKAWKYGGSISGVNTNRQQQQVWPPQVQSTRELNSIIVMSCYFFDTKKRRQKSKPKQKHIFLLPKHLSANTLSTLSSRDH